MNAFENDNFAKYLGFEAIRASDGKAEAKMDVRAEHLNGAGIVHGGAIYSLAVWALALAANSCDRDEAVSVGIGGTINYISNVSQGTIYAVAEPVHVGKRLATFHSTVSDDKGNVLAVLQGNSYRKHKKKEYS